MLQEKRNFKKRNSQKRNSKKCEGFIFVSLLPLLIVPSFMLLSVIFIGSCQMKVMQSIKLMQSCIGCDSYPEYSDVSSVVHKIPNEPFEIVIKSCSPGKLTIKEVEFRWIGAKNEFGKSHQDKKY